MTGGAVGAFHAPSSTLPSTPSVALVSSYISSNVEAPRGGTSTSILSVMEGAVGAFHAPVSTLLRAPSGAPVTVGAVGAPGGLTNVVASFRAPISTLPPWSGGLLGAPGGVTNTSVPPSIGGTTTPSNPSNLTQATTGGFRNPYKSGRSTSYSVTGVGVSTTNNNIAGNLSGKNSTPASISATGGRSTPASLSGRSTPSNVPTNARSHKSAPKMKGPSVAKGAPSTPAALLSYFDKVLPEEGELTAAATNINAATAKKGKGTQTPAALSAHQGWMMLDSSDFDPIEFDMQNIFLDDLLAI